MPALVSVIMPVFNSEATLSDTIGSLLQQTYPNWEAVCVDDGSTDNSVVLLQDFAKQDERIKVSIRERLPKGGSVCRNIGIEKSKGDYIIFLDSDDILAHSCIEKRMAVMLQDPELDFAVFPMQRFFKIPGDSDELASKESDDVLKAFLTTEFPLPWTITCPIWKKESIVKLGGFNEKYQRLQDPELHAKALLTENIKYRTYYNLPADCFYRFTGTSVVSKQRVEAVLKSYALFIEEMAVLVGQYDLKKGTNYKSYLAITLKVSFYACRNDFFIFPVIFKTLKFALALNIIDKMQFKKLLSFAIFRLSVYSLLYPVYQKVKSMKTRPI